MRIKKISRALLAGGVMTAVLAAPVAAPGFAQSAERSDAAVDKDVPQSVVEVSQGKGTLLTLPRPISDIFVVNQGVADVEVKSPREVFVYGTGGGETTFYATDSRGETVYSATIRVVRNIDQVREMLRIAMPTSQIEVQSLGGIAFLTGTVGSPAEVTEAAELVKAFTGAGTIVNKLQAAVPPQVNLRVRFAEVSRDVLKQLGVNFQAIGGSDEFLLGVTRGRDAIMSGSNPPLFVDPVGFGAAEVGAAAASAVLQGSFLGLDFNAAIDALETDGLLTTLAEPTLTALSGETASFLAGGEFPIVTTNGLGGTNVEFKQYGVGITFAPTVLNDDRIHIKVAPQLSELSEAGAVRIDGISIPALNTRTAETTVELGSGQSFMIGGLKPEQLYDLDRQGAASR